MPVIAYFGPAGTFTEMALDRLLAERLPNAGVPGLEPGAEHRRIAATSPGATLAMVREGLVDFACVPIESSLEGSVPATMDALVPPDGNAGRVQVFAETILDIAFTVAAREPLAAADVRTVAAYPVASAQVRNSIEKLYPAAQFVSAASNAAAAVDVREGRADVAITTPLAVRLHELTVLADGVADAADASTRFLLVGRPAPPPPPSGADRTSVILELPHRPGSLMSAMGEFASRGVDLTRIESRPQRVLSATDTYAVKYRFFLDAAGHIDDGAVGEALRALHRNTENIVYLGSWPADRAPVTRPPDTAESEAWFDDVLRGEAR